ncbi:hypothetical protein ACWDBF_21615 [Streptomyces angustmyceticus]
MPALYRILYAMGVGMETLGRDLKREPWLLSATSLIGLAAINAAHGDAVGVLWNVGALTVVAVVMAAYRY